MSFLSQKSQPKPSLAKRRKSKHSSLKSYKKVSSLLTFHFIFFNFSFIFSATKKNRQSSKKNPQDLVLKIMLWERKMCRLTWQLLGMLGNVLSLLGMLRNVLAMPWQCPRHACNVLGMLPARS